jgi:hypothetical protein
MNNSNSTIVFLIPHLSTGGMPQYVCWLVEELLSINKNIYVVEFSDIAPIYVVQKNKLKDMLGDNLITLYGSDEEKKEKLLSLIEEKNPGVLHLQELPEMWLPNDISNSIYNKRNSINKCIGDYKNNKEQQSNKKGS